MFKVSLTFQMEINWNLEFDYVIAIVPPSKRMDLHPPFHSTGAVRSIAPIVRVRSRLKKIFEERVIA
jgi:hypothetical protein